MSTNYQTVVECIRNDVANKGMPLEQAISYYVQMYQLEETEIRKALLDSQ